MPGVNKTIDFSFFIGNRSKGAMRFFLLCFIICCNAFHIAPACAWNATGHRLVASIAWKEMNSELRENVVRLLRAHPDYLRWQTRLRISGKTDAALESFLLASTWADDIKYDPRFYDEGDETTDRIAGYPDMKRHRDWHYLDLPLDGISISEPRGQLNQKIESLGATLADVKQKPEDRAYALVWLIHLIADLHQPLHVVSRFDHPDKSGDAGISDRGGNRLIIRNPFSLKQPETNLHAFWDNLPELNRLSDRQLDRSAILLRHNYPRDLQDSLFSAGVAPRRWQNESFILARDFCYGRLSAENPPTIDVAYHHEALALAQSRIAQAAYRLTDYLKASLSSLPNPIVSRGTKKQAPTQMILK